MSRRTPHRRISPRTVRRYQAIKNFLRRALGSTSQPDININSSITVSVLDLRQKIDGIEQQLHTVTKHCQDLTILESRLKLKDNLDSEKDTNTNTNKNIVTDSLQDRYHPPDDNRSTPNLIDCEDETKTIASNKMLHERPPYNYKENKGNKLYRRLHRIEEDEQISRKRRNHMPSKNLPVELSRYSSHSFDKLRSGYYYPDSGNLERRERNRNIMQCFESDDRLTKLINRRDRMYENHKNYRNKYLRPELDQDFIADIIRRQYRPVKLFGRRESDFSQFSAPICRDQEFSIRETVHEGSDLCSCCHKDQKRQSRSAYMRNNDLSDIRSICDTRLYSSKNNKYHRNCATREKNFYEDSAMYDVIPVKERSSPKSRRKFVENNVLMHDYYKEVPPSPRTQRPRLNLQAQIHTENNEDEIILEKQLKCMKKLQVKSLLQDEKNVSNMSSEVFVHHRNFKGMQNKKPYNEECVGTISNLQYPTLTHEQRLINNDISLNTQTTDVSVDKTDKTLGEIKDILQNFLQEIKKESSQSEKLSNSPQPQSQQNLIEKQQKINSNSFENDINNFRHCGLPPFIQSFPNSCCYPILPICPINCMQNGFVLPSPSFTCAACANNLKAGNESNDFKNKTNSSEETNSDTQKLIKEIHNLISQNPKSTQKKEIRCDNKLLASANESDQTTIPSPRDIGGSYKISKHDVKVGTTKLKSHSKSCEAIRSREATNTCYATNVSYSDTVLEKGSGEEITTESASEASEYSSESTVVDKKKGNKFTKMLRSFGILKNKTDETEELTESDNSLDVKKLRQQSPCHSHRTSPFQQHIINYNMHGQEYYHPPIAPIHRHQYEYCDHPPHYNPRSCVSPVNVDNKVKNSQERRFREQNVLTQCTCPRHMPIPNCPTYYDPQYLNVPPQVPVCFKEIEVKSIGTQSVRKMSLLQKLTNKVQVPEQPAKVPIPKQSKTRFFSKDNTSKNKLEQKLFDWKNIHEKAMQKTTDPLKFSYKTQKSLAERDNTMRNAMLKKLFYKRNPFSPRNLLVRTLLGKDKSSFGEPPKMYKPKMFL